MINQVSEWKDRKRRDEGGFTLIELLVVIIILGILTAVVVFAVSGINNRGQESACRQDVRTIRTAQEAAYAQNGAYVNEPQLVSDGFLSEESEYHNTVATDGGDPDTAAGDDYTISDTPGDSRCAGVNP